MATWGKAVERARHLSGIPRWAGEDCTKLHYTTCRQTRSTGAGRAVRCGGCVPSHPHPARRIGEPPGIERDPAVVASFLSDAAHVPGGFAAGVAAPRSEAEVAALVVAADRVLPVGAQSSLTGGATPRGELVLSTRALSAIEVPDNGTVRVGAGVPLAELQRTLAASGLYYPPVPTFDGAFVGGTIATNAAGAATFKYGFDPPMGRCHDRGPGERRRARHPARRGHRLARWLLRHRDHRRARRRACPFPLHDARCRQVVGRILRERRNGPHRPVHRFGRHAGHRGRGRAPAGDAAAADGGPGPLSAGMHRRLHSPDASGTAAGRREPSSDAVDVSAIEYMDARALRAVPDDAFRRAQFPRPVPGSVLLLVQVEVGRATMRRSPGCTPRSRLPV